MENIVLSDSRKIELAGFMKELNSSSHVKFAIKEHLADLTLKGKTKELKRYFMYFTVPLKYFINRNKYGIIVGWQQFYALIFCFYCAIFRVKKVNTIIAWNFTYKEKTSHFRKIYQWFIRMCVCTGYLDYIHVPSKTYADRFSKDFNFPRDHIIVAPFGIVDCFHEYSNLKAPAEMNGTKYFLSIGRSNRDYKFLTESWKNIDSYLVIASDKYEEENNNPKILVKKDITADRQYSWINNAEGLIISIDDPNICSGDTVLLTAMSLNKTVIITKPSALADMYIQDNRNGLLIEKKESDLKKAVQRVVDGDTKTISTNARNDFLKYFTRDKMGLALANLVNSIE